MLEPQELGELVHGILDRALRRLEAHGGLSGASPEQIEHAVAEGAARSRWNGRSNARYRLPSSGGGHWRPPAK